MNTPDPRLEDLFVRYWDNALSDAEAAALEERLRTDPAAREWFRLLSLQATTAAELSSVQHLMDSPALEPKRGPSRRRVLAWGGGVAAALLASVAGWRFLRDGDRVRMTAVRGRVWVTSSRGSVAARAGMLVPAGATVSTTDVNSGVALLCPDGSGVALTGDSAMIVHEGGQRLMLVRGNATADIRTKPNVPPLQLATAAATVTTATGALLNLGHVVRATEIVVEDGAVNVFDQAEHRLAVVGAGEMLTVEAGRGRKQPTPVTPDEYALRIDRPLPPDWHVGERATYDGRDVLTPHWWHDPYHRAEMWQIRSDKQWPRGFFRLFPDSTFHVKYWVDRPGRGQVIACVQSARLPDAETGVVELNGAFEDAKPRAWNTLAVKAADMLDNVNTPKFAAPWVGFLLIFNTYAENLGLKIAEYRVARPGVM